MGTAPATPSRHRLIKDQGQAPFARASIQAIAAPPSPARGASTVRQSDPQKR